MMDYNGLQNSINRHNEEMAMYQRRISERNAQYAKWEEEWDRPTPSVEVIDLNWKWKETFIYKIYVSVKRFLLV